MRESRPVTTPSASRHWTLRRAAVLATLALASCGANPRDAQPGAGPAAKARPGFVVSAGILIPEGFRATVFAEGVGRARHIASAPDGTIYVALRAVEQGGSIVALRDADGDGRAERIERFGAPGGTGIAVRDGYLYYSSNREVFRLALAPGEIVPRGEPELIAGGFPDQKTHEAKSFAFDGEGGLYVNSGAPSNACQAQDRKPGSAGQYPCPELDWSGGIWRFDASRPGQDQRRDGVRFATGIRNAVALSFSRPAGKLYAVVHGRDQLDSLWPQHYTAEENAEQPAEEFQRLEAGSDCGWPYTYVDARRGVRMVAPEYGGDGRTVDGSARYQSPILTFPAHWAPNDLLFYEGGAFPARYSGGAFVAFHGSWNRAPFRQGGYQVAFVPFEADAPSGPWETFADGFAGSEALASPRDAEFRPMGLAEDPAGALLIADSVRGRIWRITYDRIQETTR